MTDFIMEQEAPQVVEEAFNENELVSNFMGVCAASANVACVLECANIVEFCTTNEIAIPSIIQEGWADFWGAIKNFFKKIADWFKSLVKGTTAVFAKDELTKLIAKLKTFNQEEEVNNEDIFKLAVTAGAVITILDNFRSEVLEKIMDAKADQDGTNATTNEGKLYKALQNADAFTAEIKDANKWFKSTGAVDKTDITIAGITYNATIGSKSTDAQTYKIQDLVKDLETINKLNIPDKGEKILKAFNVTVDKIEASFSHEAIDAATGNKTKVVDKDSKSIQKTVKSAADAIATFYDKVKGNMLKVSQLAYKDAEVDKDKKKDYDKELELANKDAGRDDLRKNSNVIR